MGVVGEPDICGLEGTDRLTTLAESTAKISEVAHVSGTAQAAFGLSRVPMVGSNDAATCSDFLADVLNEHPQYTGLFQPFCPMGGCIATPRTTMNLTDRGYFRRAMNSTHFVVEPVVGRLTGKGVLQIAYPVRDSAGAVQYILLASLNLDDFGKAVASSLPYDQMNFQIWNDDGSIIMDYSGTRAAALQPGPAERAFVLSSLRTLETLGPGVSARM